MCHVLTADSIKQGGTPNSLLWLLGMQADRNPGGGGKCCQGNDDTL